MPTKKKPPRKRVVTKVHRLRVAIVGIKPTVRRVVDLPSDCTLGDLHEILQMALGWTNSHLHQFEVGNRTFGVPDLETPEWEDEDGLTLDEVAPERADVLLYEYDFGDSWEHRVVVEKIGPPEEGVTYPRCVSGARACPPEDCGGTYGYKDLLKAIAHPKNKEHAELVEWIGEGFDPEAFDVSKVNQALARLF